MPEKAWKTFERRIATIFGCRRRGVDFGTEAEGGKDDLTHEHYSIECKLYGVPSYALLLSACRQAEAAAKGREPLAVVKRKRDHDDNALVVMRLETFREWRLAPPEG